MNYELCEPDGSLYRKIIALRLSGTVQMNGTREIFVTRVACLHT